MRPMLIFLCSKLLNSGKVNDKVYRGASVIELIHTATLIHDDVVDESDKRRGFSQLMQFGKIKLQYWLVTSCFLKVCCYALIIKIMIYWMSFQSLLNK